MITQKHSGHGDNIVIYETIQKHPTILAQIINDLGARLFEPASENGNILNEFDIETKIQYNNVKRYKSIIDENKIFQGKLNSIYQELDDLGTTKKLILFQNIKNSYIKARGQYVQQLAISDGSVLDVVRAHADDIIETVEQDLLEMINQSSNLHESLEAVQVGLTIIVVDAFMRCKILEEPRP